jgi:hypothetical protein
LIKGKQPSFEVEIAMGLGLFAGVKTVNNTANKPLLNFLEANNAPIAKYRVAVIAGHRYRRLY